MQERREELKDGATSQRRVLWPMAGALRGSHPDTVRERSQVHFTHLWGHSEVSYSASVTATGYWRTHNETWS